MCYQAHILPVAAHRPGKVNVRADHLSRWKHDHTDIRLEPKVFEIIDRRYGPHSVDLFATRDNRLLDRYVSWRPDRTRGSRPPGRLHRLRSKVPTKIYLFVSVEKLQALVPRRVSTSPSLSILIRCRLTPLVTSSCTSSVTSSQACGRTTTSATTSRPSLLHSSLSSASI